MKRPTKKAVTPDKPPETDADALVDIVKWSGSRPSWQRQALRLLSQSDGLAPEQLDALYQLVVSGEQPSEPLVEKPTCDPHGASRHRDIEGGRKTRGRQCACPRSDPVVREERPHDHLR